MRFAVLGYPIGHSLSPPMHAAAFAGAGLAASYEALSVRPQELESRLDELRSGRWNGFNVTIPHKVAALKLADDPDPLAVRIGAANTLWCREGRIRAGNTDITAMREIIDSARVGSDAPAVLIGAGGAARAALLALSEFDRLTILNRTPANARALAAELSPGARVLSLDDPAGVEAARAATLIVNASSMGMTGGPAAGRSPLPEGCLGRHHVVFDMVYRPVETPLLADARNSGARTIDGLTMLVLQGAASFSIWTGRDPDRAAMRRACERAL
ncbi:MAG: shikimate dehydrogenase [Chloroflexi bacterium]|nr:shikimate dehydrogenase [Chloroflexota bacterium]